MKSLTLSPALREEDVLISKAAGPKLTYSQAVYSYFVAGIGQSCQVATCSIEDFMAFIQDCALTTKNPKVSEKALAGLDYAELLDRWYALDTLKIYGATVPLFPSIEDAEQRLQQELNRS